MTKKKYYSEDESNSSLEEHKEKSSFLELADQMNPRKLYGEQHILKVWDIYAHQRKGLNYWVDGEHVKSLFDASDPKFSMRLVKQAGILTNSNGSLYRNDKGQSVSICDSVDYMSAPVGEEEYNGITYNIKVALEQIKEWNEGKEEDKIISHIILFPYHITVNHWNLGTLKSTFTEESSSKMRWDGGPILSFKTTSSLERAKIKIYNPLGNPETQATEKVVKEIESTIQAIFTTQVKLNNLNNDYQKQQYDTTSCGPITAENGKDIISGRDERIKISYRTEQNTKELRAKHAQEIRDEKFLFTQTEELEQQDYITPKASIDQIIDSWDRAMHNKEIGLKERLLDALIGDQYEEVEVAKIVREVFQSYKGYFNQLSINLYEIFFYYDQEEIKFKDGAIDLLWSLTRGLRIETNSLEWEEENEEIRTEKSVNLGNNNQPSLVAESIVSHNRRSKQLSQEEDRTTKAIHGIKFKEDARRLETFPQEHNTRVLDKEEKIEKLAFQELIHKILETDSKQKIDDEIMENFIMQTMSFNEEIQRSKKEFESLNQNTYKNVIVIGHTAAGKSSLVNYLIGNKLSAKAIGTDLFKSTVQIEIEGEQKGPEIGKGGSSKTKEIKLWQDHENKVNYWDCPGFDDTRGETQQIANMFLIQSLINACTKVSFLFVAHDDICSNSELDKNLREVINLTKKFFGSIEKMKSIAHSISFIITQGLVGEKHIIEVGGKQQKVDIIREATTEDYIHKFRDKLINIQNNNSEYTQNADNKEYTTFIKLFAEEKIKISTFPKIKESGEVTTEFKTDIVDTINSITSIPNNIISLGHSIISNSSIINIAIISTQLNEYAKKVVTALNNDIIKKELQLKLTQATNTADLRKYLKDTKQTLKKIMAPTNEREAKAFTKAEVFAKAATFIKSLKGISKNINVDKLENIISCLKFFDFVPNTSVWVQSQRILNSL